MPKLTVINYHYIAESLEQSYGNCLLVDEFEVQLKYLRDNFKIISANQLTELGESNYCLLTFDDSLKDHFNNVLPLFRKYGLNGFFSIITNTLEGRKINPTHKVHILFKNLAAKEFAGLINKSLKENFSHDYRKYLIDDKEKLDKRYVWDDSLTANIKYMLAVMPFEMKEMILDNLFKECHINESEIFDKYYLNEDEIKALIAYKNDIGSHGHNHLRLSKLTKEDQGFEIKESKRILEEKFSIKISGFSYPFGDYNQQTIEILRQAGYKFGISTIPKVNEGIENVYQIYRIDNKTFFKDKL